MVPVVFEIPNTVKMSRIFAAMFSVETNFGTAFLVESPTMTELFQTAITDQPAE